jgi:hypothetical protein
MKVAVLILVGVGTVVVLATFVYMRRRQLQAWRRTYEEED